MHHKISQQSQFWIYCALVTIIGGVIIFNVHYSRKRIRYIETQQRLQLASLRGSSTSTVIVPRERWIPPDAQAFVRRTSFCGSSFHLISDLMVFLLCATHSLYVTNLTSKGDFLPFTISE